MQPSRIIRIYLWLRLVWPWLLAAFALMAASFFAPIPEPWTPVRMTFASMGGVVLAAVLVNAPDRFRQVAIDSLTRVASNHTSAIDSLTSIVTRHGKAIETLWDVSRSRTGNTHSRE